MTEAKWIEHLEQCNHLLAILLDYMLELLSQKETAIQTLKDEERRSKMLVKFNDPEEFLEELT
jgi:hypothetical protein